MAKTTFSRRALALVAILALILTLCSSLFVVGVVADEENGPLILQDFGPSVDEEANITVPQGFNVTGELVESPAPGSKTDNAALKVSLKEGGWPQFVMPFNTADLTAAKLSAYADGYFGFWASMSGSGSWIFELASEANANVSPKGHTYSFQTLNTVPYLASGESKVEEITIDGYHGIPAANYEGWFIIKISDFVDRKDNTGKLETISPADFLKKMVDGGAFYPVCAGTATWTLDNFCLFNSYEVKQGELIIDGTNAWEVFGGEAPVFAAPKMLETYEKYWYNAKNLVGSDVARNVRYEVEDGNNSLQFDLENPSYAPLPLYGTEGNDISGYRYLFMYMKQQLPEESTGMNLAIGKAKTDGTGNAHPGWKAINSDGTLKVEQAAGNAWADGFNNFDGWIVINLNQFPANVATNSIVELFLNGNLATVTLDNIFLTNDDYTADETNGIQINGESIDDYVAALPTNDKISRDPVEGSTPLILQDCGTRTDGVGGLGGYFSNATTDQFFQTSPAPGSVEGTSAYKGELKNGSGQNNFCGLQFPFSYAGEKEDLTKYKNGYLGFWGQIDNTTEDLVLNLVSGAEFGYSGAFYYLADGSDTFEAITYNPWGKLPKAFDGGWFIFDLNNFKNNGAELTDEDMKALSAMLFMNVNGTQKTTYILDNFCLFTGFDVEDGELTIDDQSASSFFKAVNETYVEKPGEGGDEPIEEDVDGKMLEDYESVGDTPSDWLVSNKQSSAYVENDGGRELQFTVTSEADKYPEFGVYTSKGDNYDMTGYDYLVMYMKQENVTGAGGISFTKYDTDYRYVPWTEIKTDGSVAAHKDWHWGLGEFEGWIVIDLTSLSDEALTEAAVITMHTYGSKAAAGGSTITLDNIFVTNNTVNTENGLEIAGMSIEDYLAALTAEEPGEGGEGGDDEYDESELITGNLQNGDMEEGSWYKIVSGWGWGANYTSYYNKSTDTEAAHTGKQSMKIDTSDAELFEIEGGANHWGAFTYAQTGAYDKLDVSKLKISAWVKGSDDFNGKVYIEIYSREKKADGGEDNVPGSLQRVYLVGSAGSAATVGSDWTEVSVAVPDMTVENGVGFELALWVEGTGTVWIDDVDLFGPAKASITLTNTVNGVTVSPAAPAAGEKVTLTLTEETLKAIQAGSLQIVRDEDSEVVAVPTRVGFQDPNNTDPTAFEFTMPDYNCSIVAADAAENAPNMGALGWSVKNSGDAMRAVFRMFIYEEDGTYYTEIDGVKTALSGFGVIIGTEFSKDRDGDGFLLDYDDADPVTEEGPKNAYLYEFDKSNIRYDVTSAYQDLSAAVTGLNVDKHGELTLKARAYMINAETGEIYYTEPVIEKTLNEAIAQSSAQ